MPSLTDGSIRHALKRAEQSRKEESLTDGEGRGTGRLVLSIEADRHPRYGTMDGPAMARRETNKKKNW